VRAVDGTAETLGGLDVVVPNAGTEVVGRRLGTRRRDQHPGVFYTCKWAVPYLIDRGGGAIVIMGSDGSLTGSPGYAAYVTTKHALVGLTRCRASPR
jgi:NAD(P)-dependent dehydrogenase (short-subunit alcohol dehydrogenase family)